MQTPNGVLQAGPTVSDCELLLAGSDPQIHLCGLVEGPPLSQLWLWAFCLWWALFYPGSEDGSLCFPCPPSHSSISPHWSKVSPTTVPLRCEGGSRLASRRRETYSAFLLLLAGCSLAVNFSYPFWYMKQVFRHTLNVVWVIIYTIFFKSNFSVTGWAFEPVISAKIPICQSNSIAILRKWWK